MAEARDEIEYGVVTGESAVLIEAKSNAGPIVFGTTDISGRLVASHDGDRFSSDPLPHGELAVDLRALRSGNAIYDSELVRRLDARRYPLSTIVLREMVALGTPNRYRLSGEVSLRGVTARIDGALQATVSGRDIAITGEQAFDVRDFDIPTPRLFLLRIYPDVRVHLKLLMRPAEGHGVRTPEAPSAQGIGRGATTDRFATSPFSARWAIAAT